MSLAALASHMASKGRNGDTMLVHMAPSEVAGLQALGLQHGITMTVNPHTGLPEAFSFKSLLKSALPMIAGFALGPAGFGIVSSALGAGALVGGVTALATGSLQKGLMAGLGAYGGSSLGSAVLGAGSANIGVGAAEAARTAALEQGLTGTAQDQFVQKAVADKMAAATLTDRLSSGVSGLLNESGREHFMGAIGGASGLMKAGYAAAAPTMADAMVPTTTPRTGATGYQGTIRPYDFNPYTKQWTARPTYPAVPVSTEAEKKPEAPAEGMNSGGIVALAGGGMTPEEQVRQAYAGIGRIGIGAAPSQIDPQGFSFWTQQLQSGAIKPEDFGGRFSSAVNQYLLERPNDPVTQYVTKFRSGQPLNSYFAANPDVAAEWARDRYGIATPEEYAETHWKKFGKAEQRAAPSWMTDLFPDVVSAVPGVVTTAEPAIDYTQAPTMTEVRSAYEQGGGATRMPTITDIAPGERTYTQNQVFNLLQGYLQSNPNAAYGDVAQFARAQGIPEYQARAAYNEARFSGLSGDSRSAYNYLMGRGAYPTSSVARPIMRPYAEAMGLTESATRSYVPTTPTRVTAQGATPTKEGSTTLTAAPGSVTSLPGGGTGTAVVGGGLAALPSGGAGVTGGGGGSPVITGTDRSTDLAATNPNFPNTPQAATVANTISNATGIDPLDALLLVTDAFGTAKTTSDALGNAATGVADKTGMDPMDALMLVTNAFGTGPGIHTGDTTGSLTGGLIPALVDRPVGEFLAPVESRDIIPVQERMPEVTTYYPENVYTDYGQAGEVYNPTFDYGFSTGVGSGGIKDIEFDEQMFNSGGLTALAKGGVSNLGIFSDGGRLLKGPGDGVSDSIPAVIGNRQPARLADGEFVIPARIVSELGNGSTEAGARKLYAMMDRVQRARAKTTGKGKVANNTRADKHLPA